MARRRPKYGASAATGLIAGNEPIVSAGTSVLFTAACLFSAALHATFFLCLPTPPAALSTARPVTMQVFTSSLPPPAVAVAPAPAPALIPPNTAKQTAARQPASRITRPHASAPHAPAQTANARTSATTKPVHIGLSLSSTSLAGSIGVPIDNGQDGQPTAADNTNRGAGNAPGAVLPSYQLTTAPEVDAEPDLRDFYPESERKNNKEGQVVLLLTLDNTGRVTQATVRSSAGETFDAAARRAAVEKLHFKPGKFEGKAVATQIEYKITFLLD